MGPKLSSTAQLCQQSTFVFCSWFPLALALSGGRKKLLFVTLEKFSPFCFRLFGERVKLKFQMSFIINSTISQGLSALPLLSPNGIWVYGSIEIASLFWKKSDLHSYMSFLALLRALVFLSFCFCPWSNHSWRGLWHRHGMLFWHRHGTGMAWWFPRSLAISLLTRPHSCSWWCWSPPESWLPFIS